MIGSNFEDKAYMLLVSHNYVGSQKCHFFAKSTNVAEKKGKPVISNIKRTKSVSYIPYNS